MVKLTFLLPEENKDLSKDEVIHTLISFLNMSLYRDDEDIKDAVKTLMMYLQEKITVFRARKCAFVIHQEAREENDFYKKMIKRACGHIVSTIHVKTHALRAIDYLNKAFLYREGKTHD